MTEAARRRAEACFAVARSATFEGEKAAAIGRGIAIAEAAGLDLSTFDIPGRPKAPPPPRSRFRDDMFERPRSPFFTGDWTRADIQDVWDRFTRHMAEAGAEQTKAERQRRDERPEPEPGWPSPNRVDRAISYLWNLNVRVYQGPDAGEWGDALKSATRRWIIPDESEVEYSDEGIVEVAVARGFEATTRRGASGRVYVGAFGDNLSSLQRAANFLIAAGLRIEPISESDYWLVEGEILQSRTVILAAKLRGFEE